MEAKQTDIPTSVHLLRNEMTWLIGGMADGEFGRRVVGLALAYLQSAPAATSRDGNPLSASERHAPVA